MADPENNQVGYGRPPAATRFKKGQSGNPKGRPKRDRRAPTLDVSSITMKPVKVLRNGAEIEITTYEARLRQALAKAATDKSFKHARYLFELFEELGLVKPALSDSCRVVTVPKGISISAGCLLLQLYGRPPWTKRQINSIEKKLVNMTEEEQFLTVQETRHA
jgi:hypothetical protein